MIKYHKRDSVREQIYKLRSAIIF